MIDKKWAIQFANSWVEAFNSHNLQDILSLYDDGFKMSSPFIIERMGIHSGNIVGKEAVGKYWAKSLQKHPELKFVLQDVYVGVDTIIVHYTNVGNRMVCESFRFNLSGKVIASASHHGSLV